MCLFVSHAKMAWIEKGSMDLVLGVRIELEKESCNDK